MIVNGRYRTQRLSGVQRVAHEIETRLSVPRRVLSPRHGSGPVGHAWEQLALPIHARGELIWSPCNTGPIASAHQVVTIHDAGVFDHPEWFSPAFVAFNTRLWPTLARRVRRVVTVSRFSQGRLSEVLGLPLSDIDVVWNGVDEAFRPAAETEIEAARLAVGLAPGQPYFVTLSTLEPRKNLGLVAQAFARATLPPGVALLVIGGKGSSAVFAGGRDPHGLHHPGVVMSGHVPDALLAPLLSGSLALLYPSLYEGFGLPVLEAMACGVPAVATRLTSLPEVGGDAALYVDPHDPDDLARTLGRLAQSPALRNHHAQAGIERARLFSWNKAAKAMDEILDRFQ